MDETDPARKTPARATRSQPRGQGERLARRDVDRNGLLENSPTTARYRASRSPAVGNRRPTSIHFAPRRAGSGRAGAIHEGLLRAADDAEWAQPTGGRAGADAALLRRGSSEHRGCTRWRTRARSTGREDMSSGGRWPSRNNPRRSAAYGRRVGAARHSGHSLLDLRTVIHGAVSLRVNQPERPGPAERNRWTGFPGATGLAFRLRKGDGGVDVRSKRSVRATNKWIPARPAPLRQLLEGAPDCTAAVPVFFSPPPPPWGARNWIAPKRPRRTSAQTTRCPYDAYQFRAGSPAGVFR